LPSNSKPVVDVGIPTYARPRFVADAIASVLAQDFPAWRLVVCEDGAGTPETAAAVEPYLADPRVRFMTAGSRLGLSGNKNLLLRSGSAPYVALLDDDDRWEPTFLRRRIQLLERHPQSGFAFSPVAYIDGSGHRIGQSESLAEREVLPSSEFVPKLFRGNMILTPSVLIRRAALAAVGGELDSRFPTVNDWELWLRLAIRFDTGYSSSVDASYRVHGPQLILAARIGEEVLRLLAHADALVAAEAPQLRLPPEELRRVQAGWLVSVALDAAEDGDARSCLARLAQAGRFAPAALVDRRVPAMLGGLVLGRRGRRAIARLRQRARRRRLGHP
jgi:glycosyltransferase involved in cell wall biosynthesis